MSPDEVDTLRERLLAMKAELETKGLQKLEPNRKDAVTNSDEDEQPLNEMHQTIASNRNKNKSDTLRKIKGALARIKSEPEMIGLCMECEEPIPPKRLLLMPFAQHCVKCQSALEGSPDGRRRSLRDYN